MTMMWSVKRGVVRSSRLVVSRLHLCGSLTQVTRIVHVSSSFLVPLVMRNMAVSRRACYYDVPTVALGAVALSRVRGRVPMRWRTAKSLVAQVAGGLCMGFVYHAVSVVVISRRAPHYSVRSFDRWLLPAAISEEIIWRLNEGASRKSAHLLDSVLFGVVHLPVGGWKGVAHMSTFGYVADACARKLGFASAVGFHVGFNVAREFDSRTNSW